MKKLKGYKLEINNPEEGQRAEDAAFMLGYQWQGPRGSKRNLEKGYFYLEPNGELLTGWFTENYYQDSSQEITIEELEVLAGTQKEQEIFNIL